MRPPALSSRYADAGVLSSTISSPSARTKNARANGELFVLYATTELGVSPGTVMVLYSHVYGALIVYRNG